MREFAKGFYAGKAWRECRASYIAKRRAIDGGLCEECHEKLGFIVHHKILLTPANISNPIVALNHNRLKYVCKECHEKEDVHPSKYRPVETRCSFDENGNPIETPPS